MADKPVPGYRGKKSPKPQTQRPIEIYTWADYLAIAYFEAENWSPDPSTKNGALIIDDDGKILTAGVNRFPDRVIESAERWESQTKLIYVEHAERNAIFAAAAMGIKTEGMTMVCPWFACCDCARAIIAAKIRRVVGHQDIIDFALANNPRWNESIKHANQMLDEARIERIYHKGKIGSTKAVHVGGNDYIPKTIVGKLKFEA